MTQDNVFGLMVVGFISLFILAACWDEWRARRRWARVKKDRMKAREWME